MATPTMPELPDPHQLPRQPNATQPLVDTVRKVTDVAVAARPAARLQAASASCKRGKSSCVYFLDEMVMRTFPNPPNMPLGVQDRVVQLALPLTLDVLADSMLDV
jgi:hypothetical protein